MKDGRGKAKNSKRICDGCNVRTPWGHRCFGAERCDCQECREADLIFTSRPVSAS